MKPGREPHDSFRRTRLVLGVLYALFPFVVLAIALMDRRASFYAFKATVALLYIAFVAGIQIALGFWPCPHCGKSFFGGWRMPAMIRWFSRSGRVCAHCGLPWHDEAAIGSRAA